jgi:3-deoxy-D-manno-oct-2-ulosonic acid (Kdo) hydroxylase
VEILAPLEIDSWAGPFPSRCAEALENGKILYAPRLHFDLSESEKEFLTPAILDGKSKNLSYRPATGALGGANAAADKNGLLGVMRRYSTSASQLMDALCPEYRGRLIPGFASFRPAEIAGRPTPWRKDDTRLHVDAFPSRPLHGLRILRVFSNVHPTQPRQWRVGEPFEKVARTFLPRISGPLPGSAWLLRLVRVTKTRRTLYDHLMLGIHDRMKADQGYQSSVAQMALPIPPGATWACYTDWVSHAAMSGQFAFEQTFYLPVDAMQDPSRSPLRVLERLTGRVLK